MIAPRYVRTKGRNAKLGGSQKPTFMQLRAPLLYKANPFLFRFSFAQSRGERSWAKSQSKLLNSDMRKTAAEYWVLLRELPRFVACFG